MNNLRLKLTTAAAASALVLVGCTPPTGSDSPEPTETSEAPTPEETPTSAESPDISDDQDDHDDEDSDVDEDSDIDEQDGVRTNSFNAMPDELGDLRMVSSESNPSEHRFEREYMARDEQSRLILLVYIPAAEGGDVAPVSSNSDPGFRRSADSAQSHFEDEGHDIIERSAVADGYDWECFEALQTQSGNIDHSFCLTTSHGRVIELQRLAVHDPDEQARNSHMDVLVDEVSAGLVDIGS